MQGLSLTHPLYSIGHKLPHQSLTVYPISDVHIGAHGHARTTFLALIAHIAEQDESHRILLVGDLGDIAIKDSASFSHGAATPDEELDAMRKALTPVKERVDLLLPGNHERRLGKVGGLNWTQQLAVHLGRPECYRPTSTALRYQFWEREDERGGHRLSCTVVAAHGWGGGRSPGAKLNKAASLSNLHADADVYLMGHVHEQIAWTTTVTTSWPPKCKEQRYVVIGTHLGPEHYGIDYGYRASAVGVPVITLDAKPRAKDTLRVRVSL